MTASALIDLSRFATARGWETHHFSTEDLEEYLCYLADRTGKNGKPISETTVYDYYKHLGCFFRWAVERGLACENPLEPISPPPLPERLIPTYHDDELDMLLELTDFRLARTPTERFLLFRNRAILTLLLDTPGRREEIASLHLDDVDIDQRTIRVIGKGNKERLMVFGDNTAVGLADYLVARELRLGSRSLPELWVSSYGEALHGDGLYQVIKSLGQRAGMPDVTVHRFRHTFAMRWLRATPRKSERSLRILGGWKKKIPETYVRTFAIEAAREDYEDFSPADQLLGHPRRRR